MILTILGEPSAITSSFFLLPSSRPSPVSAKAKSLEFRGGISGGNAATCQGVSVVSDRGAVEKNRKNK